MRSLQKAAVAAIVVSMMGVQVAQAQDHGHVGAVMGYPTSVGVIWHVSDSFAIRPELSFAFASSEAVPSPSGLVSTSSNDQTVVSVGVSALFYLKEWDKARTYVSPRYAYSHTSVTSESIATSEVTTNSHLVAGSFGAQYSLGTHFAVFGEVGLTYSHSSGSSGSSVITVDINTNSVSTRSGAGVILYF
jgi:hypothetical protein